MATIRITKEFHFEMAHALENYDGACKNIHGHSYKLFITLKGQPLENENSPKKGMVLDFQDLKKLVKRPVVDWLDHSLVLNSKTPKEFIEQVSSLYEKVHVFDFQPTCENLVIYIAQFLRDSMPDSTVLHSVKLYETASSFAEWYAEDNK